VGVGQLEAKPGKRKGQVEDRTVYFRGDGEPRSPIQLASFLSALPTIAPDSYSLGGAVARLEETFADLLGKERALFCPTGTLANHLAVWRLCAGRPRAIVQASGHIYNDTGDGLTRLCGITMVPIGQDRPTFCADELRAELARAGNGRVVTPVGCVVVESPVRRGWGQCFPITELRAIADLTREHGAALHLDGARLFMMSAATGVAPREYADLFDSVYVSLYKYFGAPFGAILAGPASLIDGLCHERRMFGGGLPSAALAAAAALEGLPGFEERFAAALAKAHDLFVGLSELPGLCVAPFEHGSNIFTLHVDDGTDRKRFIAALAEREVVVAESDQPADFLPLTVNVTMLRQPNEQLVAAFGAAAQSSQ
jgi:threonine aldolase